MNSNDVPLTDKGFAPPPPQSPVPSQDKLGSQGGFESPRPGIPPGPAGADVIEKSGSST